MPRVVPCIYYVLNLLNVYEIFFSACLVEEREIRFSKEAAVLWQSPGMESKDEGQVLNFPLENQLTLGKSFN